MANFLAGQAILDEPYFGKYLKSFNILISLFKHNLGTRDNKKVVAKDVSIESR